jgi:hypothetical protein
MNSIHPQMIPIEIPYSEVRGKRIEFEFNNHLLMAWLFIVYDDDVIKIWEFQFEEV